jgi:hypothetical protein
MNATATLDTGAAAYLRLEQALHASAEAQWQMGTTPKPREDTTERSRGTTSDPVYATLVDGNRVKLRDAVVKAEKARAEYRRALAISEHVLARALAER